MSKIKTLSALIILIFMVQTARAQAFYGGIALGGAVSQVEGDMRSGWNKAGMTAGVFTGLNINDNIDFQIELKYVQKGSKSDIDNPVIGDPYAIRLGYFELPLLFSGNLGFLNINGNKLDWISIELGASLDVLAHQKKIVNGVTDNGPNFFRRFSSSTLLGIKFTIMGRYQLAFRSVNSITSIYKGNLSDEWTRRFGSKGVFSDNLELVFFYKIK
ncbi:MAG: outer membrane beta-barrel protein [Candidatus Limimorpha sp.]